MKQLLVVRHASAENKAPGQTDFERTLNPEGIRDAVRLGKLLSSRGAHPEVIFASSAVRARHTAILIAEHTGLEPHDMQCLEALYTASAQSIIALLASLDDAAVSAMVVGHNPAMSQLIARLTSESTIHLAPSGCALIGLSISSWSDMPIETAGKLVFLEGPVPDRR